MAFTKSFPRPIVVSIVTFILVAGGLGVYFLAHRHRQPSHADLMEMEKKILRDPKSQNSDVISAMVRLSQDQDSFALEETLKRYQHESAAIRQGAASALGHYESPKALEALSKLLEDPIESVRIGAIFGLTRKRTPERVSLLNKYLERDNLSSLEKVVIYSNLIHFSETAAEKEQSQKKLIKEVKTSHDQNAKLQGFMVLTQFLKTDASVRELFEFILENEKTPPLPEMALRQLALNKNPKLKPKYKNYLLSKSPQLQIAALQSIHLVCPGDRWEGLEEILKTTKDPQVSRAVLEAAQKMPGKSLVTFLEKLIKNKTLSDEDAKSVGQVLERLAHPAASSSSSATLPKDPCDKS